MVVRVVRNIYLTKKAKIKGATLIVAPFIILLYVQVYPAIGKVRYPLCPTKAITGTHCPTCGATRAFESLLQGDINQMIAFNFLSPILFLLIFLVYINILYKYIYKKFIHISLTNNEKWFLIVILLVIWFLRNNVQILAPHILH